MADLVEPLSAVPGLAGVETVDWLDAYEDTASELYKVPSGASVSVAKIDGEFGRLSVQIGARQAYAVCEYDVTSWVGNQRAGMHMAPPYFVRLSDQEGAYERGA
ncbi:hypothetical protein KGQ20_11235 [Catenulispora sp. NF23]|uniref:Uncharacterized protein n=1 Tax=Catenulispora pinistramenti TaxID=2705254 RepID=A0ABS5KJC5_9ACTN|nr:hypothetical protein [Catenulispora pinistramenti]MBS2533348.1 hypothetical protein [Catenulispora pinistramenti]MBS2546434.1 hypothetical protein [Catenulispora pinistramenti]